MSSAPLDSKNTGKPSKKCEPTAFDGYCNEHHVPIEKCWQTPPNTDNQLEDEILLCLSKPYLHERTKAVLALILKEQQRLLTELEPNVKQAISGDWNTQPDSMINTNYAQKLASEEITNKIAELDRLIERKPQWK